MRTADRVLGPNLRSSSANLRSSGPLDAHPIVLGTSGALAKGLNTQRVPDGSPLIGTPRAATQPLLFQAARKIGKGQDRKKVMRQLQTSTRKAPAAVLPAAPAATARGSGGGGYSGAVASRLGEASNPGYTTPAAPRPKP